MNVRAVLAASSVFALAACGGEPATDEYEPGPEFAESEEAAQSSAEAAEDTALEQGAEPAMADQQVASAAIPDPYHGIWDSPLGTCMPGSETLLTVSGNQVEFYESVGTVTALEDNGDDINVTLAMSGEGETWEDTYVMVLEDGSLNMLQMGTNSGMERVVCAG